MVGERAGEANWQGGSGEWESRWIPPKLLSLHQLFSAPAATAHRVIIASTLAQIVRVGLKQIAQ